MKRLAINLLIGILIGLITLCVTTEVIGFIFVNNNLPEYVLGILFSEGTNKLFISICAGIIAGIILFIFDSDISEWKKVISVIILGILGIIYMFAFKLLEIPTEKIIYWFVYFTIIMVETGIYNTINKEILKKDIKKINEKLQK